MSSDRDPIIAIATAAGRAGIGVVRLSGPSLGELVSAICGRPLAPRHATLVKVVGADGAPLDTVIGLFYEAPHSYTGEDVLELQGHGGPVVQQMLMRRCMDVGAGHGLRLAQPGEFTRRAFLNDKLDLAQAEAVADLIDAGTTAAARAASASLSGAFSQRVNGLVEDLTQLRLLIEATLDFPEEEIDFLEQSRAHERLEQLRRQLEKLLERAGQGAILREGLKVVLVGAPNVGKSSLLNALAGSDVAIVTPIAGTTRDKVTETIEIEGIALHIIDTAGLRPTTDEVEQIGIARTWKEVEGADVILHLRDVREPATAQDAAVASRLPGAAARRVIVNKIDLVSLPPRVEGDHVYLSALSGAGIDLLRRELLAIAGWHPIGESPFLARERHLAALRSALVHVRQAHALSERGNRALELLAEELRLAQIELGQITDVPSADELLGQIFGQFCIGK